ncbi:MAG: hypothetical protein WC777_01945 [Candidatus Gracilibacteria bacterium]|jgi:hypothetical protein
MGKLDFAPLLLALAASQPQEAEAMPRQEQPIALSSEELVAHAKDIGAIVSILITEADILRDRSAHLQNKDDGTTFELPTEDGKGVAIYNLKVVNPSPEDRDGFYSVSRMVRADLNPETSEMIPAYTIQQNTGKSVAFVRGTTQVICDLPPRQLMVCSTNRDAKFYPGVDQEAELREAVWTFQGLFAPNLFPED